MIYKGGVLMQLSYMQQHFEAIVEGMSKYKTNKLKEDFSKLDTLTLINENNMKFPVGHKHNKKIRLFGNFGLFVNRESRSVSFRNESEEKADKRVTQDQWRELKKLILNYEPANADGDNNKGVKERAVSPSMEAYSARLFDKKGSARRAGRDAKMKEGVMGQPGYKR